MSYRSLVAAVVLFSVAGTANAVGVCRNENVLGPSLITDICWSCIFPIKVAGSQIVSEGDEPDGAYSGAVCACDDDLGVPRPGFTTSMWEPARLVEFQRTPGCSSVLNGTQLPIDQMNRGTHGNAAYDSSDPFFAHYHYYSFPLLVMLDLYVKKGCVADGYMDFDMMYLSELDPTWNSSELAFFTAPESAAVANPVAAAACSADAVSSTAGKPLESMWWCAGSWGTMYPLSGQITGGSGTVRDSSRATARVLTALHRRGLAYKTIGHSAMCEAPISPTLPKSQYKFTTLRPRPETGSAHVLGESTLKWGMNRTVPGIGQDMMFTIWRWRDCCNN